jgi:hypothetical protein
MSDQGDLLEHFVDGLCALELDPELLQRAPTGEGWLPAELGRMAAEHPACADELAEFVAMELELHQHHQQPGLVDRLGPSDVFFTRRVMDRLPEIAAIDERRRTWILASSYALAIGVAYLLLGPLLSSGALAGYLGSLSDTVFGSLSGSLHDWGHNSHALEASGAWFALALLVVAGCLCITPIERRRADA